MVKSFLLVLYATFKNGNTTSFQLGHVKAENLKDSIAFFSKKYDIPLDVNGNYKDGNHLYSVV